MNNKTTTQSATKIGEQQTGSYLQLLLYRAPEKNNGAIAKNLKQFVPWFKERNARVEYNQLNEIQTQSVIHSAQGNGMDDLDNLTRILSTTSEDVEEVWMETQYFRDYEHCEQVCSKMMLDKSIEPVGKEFFGLVTEEKRFITGRGFGPLKE